MRKDDVHTRNAILQAAIPLFADRGLAGVTVREICLKARVNSALISYHFKGKEGLYEKCLSEFVENRLQVIERILKPALSKDDFRVRLELFCFEFLSSHAESPDLHKMLQRELELQSPKSVKFLEKSLQPIFYTVETFFRSAQKKKIVSKQLDPSYLTMMLFGILSHPMQCEKAMQRTLNCSIRDREVQKKLTKHILELFCKGVFA